MSTTRPYVCTKCHASGVKLWRDYNTVADRTRLLCARCALADQGKEGPVDAEGRRETKYGRTDQIGFMVPAVPSGDTFWGYTSVPAEDVAWWRALPTEAQQDGGTRG